jgi:hypothetical protein
MKNKFVIQLLPKNFTLLGILYDEGEAEDLTTGKRFPVYKISFGLLVIIFEFVFNFEKGEK